MSANENPAAQRELQRLRQILITRCSESDLRTFCFELGMKYANVPGDGYDDKARELLLELERRNRLSDLIAAGKRVRPDIDWENVSADLAAVLSMSPAPGATPIYLPPAITRPQTPVQGRDPLLASLRQRLRNEPGVRLALDGPAGVGKTRLLLELAFDPQIRQHFRGGILMVSLGPDAPIDRDLQA